MDSMVNTQLTFSIFLDKNISLMGEDDENYFSAIPTATEKNKGGDGKHWGKRWCLLSHGGW